MFAMYVFPRCSTRLSQKALAYCCLLTRGNISSAWLLTVLNNSATKELWSPTLSILLQFVFLISRQAGSQLTSTLCTKPSTAALATPINASDCDDKSTLGASSLSIRFLRLSSSCCVFACQ